MELPTSSKIKSKISSKILSGNYKTKLECEIWICYTITTRLYARMAHFIITHARHSIEVAMYDVSGFAYSISGIS